MQTRTDHERLLRKLKKAMAKSAAIALKAGNPEPARQVFELRRWARELRKYKDAF